MRTPEELAVLVVRHGYGMSNQLTKHLRPLLLEDLEQAVAKVIHQDRQAIKTAILNVANEVYPD